MYFKFLLHLGSLTHTKLRTYRLLLLLRLSGAYSMIQMGLYLQVILYLLFTSHNTIACIVIQIIFLFIEATNFSNHFQGSRRTDQCVVVRNQGYLRRQRPQTFQHHHRHLRDGRKNFVLPFSGFAFQSHLHGRSGELCGTGSLDSSDWFCRHQR